MTNLFHAELEYLAIHKVGNISRNEKCVLSDTQTQLNQEQRAILNNAFLSPFRNLKSETFYQFYHEVDLDFNEMYENSKCFFDESLSFLSVSRDVTKRLYQQSNHPHIKAGDVCVCKFSNITVDDTLTDAIGIFKFENKSDFLKIIENQNNLDLLFDQGIALSKLDKACLIFDTNKENGYKILSIDNNRYDARYWLEAFLGVDTSVDANYQTAKYMKFCDEFAKKVVLPAEDKKEEILFRNNFKNYFKKNNTFDEVDFVQTTLGNPAMAQEFQNFKTERGSKYNIEDLSTFDISNKAVTETAAKLKNYINLDTGATIVIGDMTPEMANAIIEKGWDEEKQMYYYLIYFNNEKVR